MSILLGVTDSDGFAIAMLAILVTSFSFVLLIVVGVVRNARKHGQAIEESAEDEANVQPAGEAHEEKKPEPWEKPADWWKGDA